ncbi:MAG TPA: hypothetical protein VF230_12985 [Acidimicrobiales bacterium]
MPLLIDELAKQVLEQTRIVTNGPLLQPEEPLRLEVIPGGGAGAQPVSDTLNFVLGSSTSFGALQIDVTYKIQRNGADLTEQTASAPGQYIKIPQQTASTPATVAGLLSFAFLLAPKIKLVKAKPPTDVRLGLPALDHKLIVTVTVKSPKLTEAEPSRTVEIPFTVPTISIPLPIPPAVCICAEDANLGGERHLVMLPPGSPESVAQIVAAYNSVLDTLNALESVLSLLSAVVAPLKLVTKTLAKISAPYITTSARVQDFDDYDNFDDEMSSFLIVAPTGYGVKFSDTANPGDWDDTGDNGMRTYKVIDILQLPGHAAYGSYLMNKLAMNATDLTTLRDRVAELSGVTTDKAQLGIGVFFVHDLASSETPHDLRHYETSGDTDEEVNDDVESAMWITGEG